MNFKPSTFFLNKYINYSVLYWLGMVSVIILLIINTLSLDIDLHEKQKQFQQERDSIFLKLITKALEDQLNDAIQHSFGVFHQLTQHLNSQDDLHNHFFEEIAHFNTDVVSYLYLTSPNHIVCAKTVNSSQGNEAKKIGQKWVFEQWDELYKTNNSCITLFHIRNSDQLWGILIPNKNENSLTGVLVLVYNLNSIVKEYIEYVETEGFNFGYLMDDQGTILYASQKEHIGHNGFDMMQLKCPEIVFIEDFILSQSSGKKEYANYHIRYSQMQTLISWNTFHIFNQKLILVLMQSQNSLASIILTDSLWQKSLLNASFMLVMILMTLIYLGLKQHEYKKSINLFKEKNQKRAVDFNDEIAFHKYFQESLKESEERLRSVIDATPDAIVVYDEKGIPIHINQSFSQIFGFDLDELKTKPIDFISEENSSEMQMMMTKVLFGEPLIGLNTYRYTKQKIKIPVCINGSIYRNRVGKPIGTVFVFQNSDKHKLPNQTTIKSTDNTCDFQTKKVLVADNSQMYRGLLRDFLRSNAFQVKTVDSGHDIIKELMNSDAEVGYDLLLIDWKFQDMEGIDIAQTIKHDERISKKPKIILMLAYGRDPLKKDAKSFFIDAFLTKPFSLSSLMFTIKELFRNSISESNII
ncbi:MAG: PAS domain S-box protein [Desulfobacterales bacterium]|nr:PAS domain S-box protein [Desulfobacterales bacterium]